MTEVNSTHTVDEEIYQCLNLNSPRSFFLFAGAGSGKTRSLVEVLKRFRENNILQLRRNGQKVAVITYTNAACDEIKRRLDFDAAFDVSTIHSFSWELIKHYTNDIREWLRTLLREDISVLEEEQRRGRAGTKAAEDRPRKIASKRKRLEALDQIKKFTYNPNGDNTTRDSLSHSEVINLTADFLLNRPSMQKVLVRKYPILLIDESQDTRKELIDALFCVQKAQEKIFSLGLFGDIMQRIYADGKPELENIIPDNWRKPAKTINYRCPKRVITLINKIRVSVDGQTQVAEKQDDGIVRLFIVDTNSQVDKQACENAIRENMAEITADSEWRGTKDRVKTLTLEHHMTAKRGGFSKFFDPLYAADKLKTGLLDGSLAGASFFAKQVLPLIKSVQDDNLFSVCRIVEKYSPLLNKKTFKNSANPRDALQKANEAVLSLYDFWSEDRDPVLIDILKEIHRSGLFQIPESLLPIAARGEVMQEAEKAEEADADKVIDAWDEALKSSFSQFEEYVRYISEESSFGTHQGIKGLEFPRVMVILDDEDARGFMFSYDKLFGAKEPTATDRKNESEGKETSTDRTRRLFYVTCSRAESSLAIVAYTKEPGKVKEHAVSQEWFEENEIVCDVNGAAKP